MAINSLLKNLTEEEIDFLNSQQAKLATSNQPRCRSRSISKKHNKATLDYIPPGDRAYLVAMLSVGAEVVGHLCLIGKETACFSKDQKTFPCWPTHLFSSFLRK